MDDLVSDILVDNGIRFSLGFGIGSSLGLVLSRLSDREIPVTDKYVVGSLLVGADDSQQLYNDEELTMALGDDLGLFTGAVSGYHVGSYKRKNDSKLEEAYEGSGIDIDEILER